MKHYKVVIEYRKKDKIDVIIEKKELNSFVCRYSKGAVKINIEEVHHDEEN